MTYYINYFDFFFMIIYFLYFTIFFLSEIGINNSKYSYNISYFSKYLHYTSLDVTTTSVYSLLFHETKYLTNKRNKNLRMFVALTNISYTFFTV